MIVLGFDLSNENVESIFRTYNIDYRYVEEFYWDDVDRINEKLRKITRVRVFQNEYGRYGQDYTIGLRIAEYADDLDYNTIVETANQLKREFGPNFNNPKIQYCNC